METVTAPAAEAETVIELVDADAAPATEALTEEAVFDAWKKVTDKISNPRVRSGVTKFSPEYDKDANVVIQYVLNVAQKDWIEKNLLVRLQADLQKHLDNKDIQLRIDVREDDDAGEVRKPYTTREVAQAMREKNSDLNRMEIDLDLEIK